MFDILKTNNFDRWLSRLKDKKAINAIMIRISSFKGGYFGDFKYLKGGLYEARIHVSKGYRLYYMKRGQKIIILLLGGDKSSQQRDIEKARFMMEKLQ